MDTCTTASYRTINTLPLWLRACLRLCGCSSTILTIILLGVVPKFVQGTLLRTSWGTVLGVLQAHPAHSVSTVQSYRPSPQPLEPTTTADALQHALSSSICTEQLPLALSYNMNILKKQILSHKNLGSIFLIPIRFQKKRLEFLTLGKSKSDPPML